MHWPRRPRKPQCGDYNEKPNESITHQLYFQNTLLTQVFNDFNHLSDEYGGYISLMGCLFFPRKNRLRIRKPNRLISSSLRASSPFWASEASLARTCERAAKPRGAEERPSAPRSRVLARLTLLAQIGELARRLHILLAHPSYLPRFPLFHPTLRASTYGEVRDLSLQVSAWKYWPDHLVYPSRVDCF